MKSSVLVIVGILSVGVLPFESTLADTDDRGDRLDERRARIEQWRSSARREQGTRRQQPAPAARQRSDR